MSTSYSIESVKGILEICFTESPNMETLLGVIDRLAASDFKGPILYDLTTGVNLSGNELEIIAAHANRLLADNYPSATVSPDDLGYGLSRMYSVYRNSQPYGIHPFRSKNEALLWLQETSTYIE